MKNPGRCAGRLYSLSLRIYPAGFRAEFAAEMLRVFILAEQDAAACDLFTFIRFCWLEWFGLLGGAAREYKSLVIQRGEMKMAATRNSYESNLIQLDTGAWKHAILAGLPFLLFGAIAAAGQLIYAYYPYLVALITVKYVTWLRSIFLMASVGVVVYAWWRGFPIWSASWYGYAAFATMAGLALLNERLAVITDTKLNNALAFVGIALLAFGVLWLFRKDARKGMLVTLFLMPMTVLMFIEFVPPRVKWLVWLGFGLMTALSAAGIVLLPDWRKGFWLVLGLNIITGISIAYIESYLIEMPSPHIHTPSLAEAGGYLLVYTVLILLLVVGPVIFWRIWDFGRGRHAGA